jgi:hypothetical protein
MSTRQEIKISGLAMVEVYENLKKEMFRISGDQNLLSEPVMVRARVLTTDEAIGSPEAENEGRIKGVGFSLEEEGRR